MLGLKNNNYGQGRTHAKRNGRGGKPSFHRRLQSLTSPLILPLALTLPLLAGLTGCGGEKYTVKVYKPDKVWDSYTLPSGALGGNTSVIDMEGNLVTRYNCAGFPAKLLPDSSILCHNLEVGWLVVPKLRQVSQDGQILWEFKSWYKNSAKQHHDFQFSGGNPVGYYVPGENMDMIGPASGGNMLVLGFYPVKQSEQNIRRGLMDDSVLYEIDPAGNVLWEWHAREHIDEMGFSPSALKDLRVELLLKDWLHVNTASYIGPNKWYSEFDDQRFHPDNIIIASPRARWVVIVDKVTGKIVWRLGPDYSPGSPSAGVVGGLNFSHGAHIVPQGLPGAGNLLVYDNGTASGYGDQTSHSRDYSRALEIDPITQTVVWEYRTPYSPNMGSLQRLPNGNTFITEGLSGRMIEVTPEKEVVWEARGFPLYRAYRVPKEWVKPAQTALTP
ncbi:MAG TPA: aryl-sulfate sulfotransferase [Dongiaceae bacterium]|nr:aryl-sulfate sulfotransferase [Dongiaceae bacterium]